MIIVAMQLCALYRDIIMCEMQACRAGIREDSGRGVASRIDVS